MVLDNHSNYEYKYKSIIDKNLGKAIFVEFYKPLLLFILGGKI